MKEEIRNRVIGVRLTESQYSEFMRLAAQRHSTASTIGRVLIELWLREEVQI